MFTRTNQIFAQAFGHIPVLKHLWGDPFRAAPERQRKHALHRRFLKIIKAAAADVSLDLVFVHWNLTRGDYGQFPRKSDPSEAAQMPYWHYTFKMMDVAFGEVRQTMEDAGTWDQTAVILLSDRGMEDRDFDKIPFLVKLAGPSRRGGRIDAPFNISRLRALVNAIRHQRITDASSLQSFVQNDAAGR